MSHNPQKVQAYFDEITENLVRATKLAVTSFTGDSYPALCDEVTAKVEEALRYLLDSREHPLQEYRWGSDGEDSENKTCKLAFSCQLWSRQHPDGSICRELKIPWIYWGEPAGEAPSEEDAPAVLKEKIAALVPELDEVLAKF